MNLENYKCDGQMNIFDFLPKNEPIFPVKISGLLDDAYCPKCGYPFDELKGQVDCERCPECKIRVDWSPWHMSNDKEETHGEKACDL